MVYIAYYTELNLQVHGNSEYGPDEYSYSSFALAERLPTSATLHNIIDVPNSNITCDILKSMKLTLKKGINEINQ